MREIPPVYNPAEVEQQWYRFWEERGDFAPVSRPGKAFTVMMPPPNVTGVLHIGHALDHTLQDVLVRFHRMRGEETLWVPGMDHAGIHTQLRVEEMLRSDGLDRHSLGREEFVGRVWEWKEKYGGIILQQLRRLGDSCDWDHERFTLDEGCSEAVREVFVRLYEEGLLYRGERIINWCPVCRTALSDIEVEHLEREGALHHIAYSLDEGEGQVVVATTRPETMLGDVAVAVHPEDERYAHLIGRMLRLPLVGRQIPVVADPLVEREFGTGAVKVTPAHDPTDFEIGQRHGLPFLRVIGEDGRMTEEAGRFASLSREEARTAVLEALRAEGALLGVDPHPHAVGHCGKCHTVIEPLLSKQWFVRMAPLAEPAIEAVKGGRMRFVPDRFEKTYLNWMENVRDWCVSRQILWGHRIPAWHCADCGAVSVSRVDLSRCLRCGSLRVERDPDVLDTWFSSALWPFSTLGWPRDTADLRRHYPTSVLVTAYDIIFFWVARMLFQGLHFPGDVPFETVLIHGLVRDDQGRKMSKSLGNGVDPLQVIEEKGADSLRFALVTGNTPGNDLKFHWERVEQGRNFANKLWNAARFVRMNLGDLDVGLPPTLLSRTDRFILGRLNQVTAAVTEQLTDFDLGEAARTLYDFIWGEYCDWYIEMAKGRLGEGVPERERKTARYVLWQVLEQSLRLLHPFMPFITEAIWQAIPHEGESLIRAPWPEPGPVDERAIGQVERVMEVIRVIRNLRAEVKLPVGKAAPVYLDHGDPAVRELLMSEVENIRRLARVSDLGWLSGERPRQALSGRAGDIEVFLPLAGLVDLDAERRRLEKELADLRKDILASEAKLKNPRFRERAPQDVVAKEEGRQADLTARVRKAEERLSSLA